MTVASVSSECGLQGQTAKRPPALPPLFTARAQHRQRALATLPARHRQDPRALAPAWGLLWPQGTHPRARTP